ncbi:MAG: AmmeMemoRadiSam system radical SAM enzyme [Syntrophomonadaceae bacterium]
MAKEAMFFEQLGELRVQCQLCPHRCKLKPGQKGICRVRSNQAGSLVTSNYGQVASLALDPIEKKPLYHFFPGTMILSAGTYGCNLSCSFCQNYALAHQTPPARFIPPESLVLIAEQAQSSGSVGVAFTYNEPSIWYEYIWDCARLLKDRGQKVVLVTNGYIEARPLNQLLPFIDALNIDVKAFTNDFYKKLCKGTLAPVINTVEEAAARAHVEITTLIIPGDNDQLEHIDAMAKWLASIRSTIPLHLSRYHPAYKYDRPPTPEATLIKARQTAMAHLPFVYLGNVAWSNDTGCLNCQALLIRRSYYRTEMVHYEAGRCSSCGAAVDYIVS